jgi:hypothetical protein
MSILQLPASLPPLFWDMHDSARHNTDRVQHYIQQAEDRLRGAVKMDEAAVLMPNGNTTAMMPSLLRQLADSGWEFFNMADDRVHTSPFGTKYQVSYRFFRHPDFAWRLEVMRLKHPFHEYARSPLHGALLAMPNDQPGWKLPMPHLSFKVPNGDQRAYSAALDMLRHGHIHAQTCQSTYGHFSYWLPGSEDWDRQLYVKPRVNHRDVKVVLNEGDPEVRQPNPLEDGLRQPQLVMTNPEPRRISGDHVMALLREQGKEWGIVGGSDAEFFSRMQVEAARRGQAGRIQ